MRQLIGWYNVVDFSGDCKGQIKVCSPVCSLFKDNEVAPESNSMHDCNRQVSVYLVFPISKIALCPGQSVTKLALNIETSMKFIIRCL